MDYGQWTRYTSYNDRWRTLLAWQRLYVELFEHPKMKDLKNVTFETNTTQFLHTDFKEYPTDRIDLQSLELSKTFQFGGELGRLLLSPKWSLIMLVWTIVMFISSLLCLIGPILMRLAELLVNIQSRFGMSCVSHALGGRSEEYNPNVQEVANPCMERGWRSHPTITYPVLAMPGELKLFKKIQV